MNVTALHLLIIRLPTGHLEVPWLHSQLKKISTLISQKSSKQYPKFIFTTSITSETFMHIEHRISNLQDRITLIWTQFETLCCCKEEYLCLLQVSYQEKKDPFTEIFELTFYKNLNYLLQVRKKSFNRNRFKRGYIVIGSAYFVNKCIHLHFLFLF